MCCGGSGEDGPRERGREEAEAIVVVGIDVSTRNIDLVLLDMDTDAAEWHRYELEGADLIERVRSVQSHLHSGKNLWDDVLAAGIERPAGRHGVAQVSMAFGAVLNCLPRSLLVQPWLPASWRKACGLPGNCAKDGVTMFGWRKMSVATDGRFKGGDWPQDAYDAYAVAYATRSVLVVGGGDQTTA